MKNLKENIKILKELWAIPRWNALLKMGLYFLFFIIFGTLFFSRVNYDSIKKNKNTNNLIKDTTSYNFTFKINNNIIEGSKIGNVKFKYNDSNYQIIDDIITCNLDDCNIDFIYLFELFTPNRINKYISNGNLLSKTEYTDGIMEYKYEINDEDVKKYFESDLNFEISNKENIFTINLENYNIFDKIVLEYK